MSVHTGEHVLVVVLDEHPDPEAVAVVAVLLLLAALILWV